MRGASGDSLVGEIGGWRIVVEAWRSGWPPCDCAEVSRVDDAAKTGASGEFFIARPLASSRKYQVGYFEIY